MLRYLIGISPVKNSSIRFPWAGVVKALNDGSKHSVYNYRLASGGEVSPTIGAQAERIAAGTRTLPTQETCSFVYHCAQGKGSTTLTLTDGQKVALKWVANDTFAVPNWSVIEHEVEEGEDVYFFVFQDRPLMISMGMWSKNEPL